MSNFITSHEGWLAEYHKDKYNVWIRATLSNGMEYYLPNHENWLELKTLCDQKHLKVQKLGLQYRSHFVEVDTGDADGVYLVRSLIGRMGEKSKQAITIGKVYGSTVKKTMWVTPELVADISDEDPIESCFLEALILYDKETK
jgi:hypothetical protein